MTHNNPCVSCIKQDVCKYKDEYIEAKSIIENKASVYDEFMTVDVYCKSYIYPQSTIYRAVKNEVK